MGALVIVSTATNIVSDIVSALNGIARPRTLLIAHRVRQRPHESFYPTSTTKPKSITPYKNLIVYELFKFFIIVNYILHILASNHIALAYC